VASMVLRSTLRPSSATCAQDHISATAALMSLLRRSGRLVPPPPIRKRCNRLLRSGLCLGVSAVFTLLQLNCDAPPPTAGVPLLPPRIIENEPSWSPTGDSIAYTHYPSNAGAQIWLVDLRTRERTFLTTGAEAAWSPTASRLAFIRNHTLYTHRIDTHEEQHLINVPRCHDPAWSPDGERIAFDWDYSDPTGTPVLWLLQADGTRPRDISQHGVGTWLEPQWSPDGELLLHIRAITGATGGEVFVMDTTGGRVRRITTDNITDGAPSWSPDGASILWVPSRADPPLWGIWVMQEDGSNRRQLIEGGSGPRWSRDGRSIAFAKFSGAEGGVVLWTMDADGGNAKPLPRR
jgi:Tol biopolymer transport system component